MRVNASRRLALASLAVLAGAGLGSALPMAGAHPAARTTRTAGAARCLVPGTTRTIDQLWRPDMDAALAYARARIGDIAFAVRTDARFYGYRPDHDEWSASVVKAMLLVTYLDQPAVRNRALRPSEMGVLGPMIRISDNDDAQEIFDTVGQAGQTWSPRSAMSTSAWPSPPRRG